VLFYLTLNDELTDSEANACVQYMTLGAAINVVPSWAHFLLCGYFLERLLHKEFEIIRKAFVRNLHKPTLNHIVQIAVQENFDVNEAIRLCAHTFLVGGCAGLEVLTLAAVHEFKNKSTLSARLEQWRNNPYNFMKEAARLNTSPNAVTVVLDQDIDVNIRGKSRKIFSGTCLILQHMIYHRDPNVFGGETKDQEYANTFDPNRPNLNVDLVNWNGLEKNVSKRDAAAAPRYCPGHDMALFLAQFLIDQNKAFDPKQTN